jgi:hypothetical protein
MGMMEMPTRTAEHDKLNFYIGEWKTKEVHQPSPWAPNGATGEGRCVTKWGVAKLCLLTEYKSKSGMGEFEGHAVQTWDPTKKDYVNYWFDSMMPQGMESRGRIEGSDLILMSSCETPEGTMKMKMVSHPVSEKEYTLTLQMDQGGKWTEMMSITYTKL